MHKMQIYKMLVREFVREGGLSRQKRRCKEGGVAAVSLELVRGRAGRRLLRGVLGTCNHISEGKKKE